ncbi:MAG TPA: shikimate kinase [Methylomusa anaerophila]|uniref:Shikimate kinase n=1 Tax=Methylomusa anaerophila TaxID=1930071 RepID=A0A348AQG1_9FIRM|nr:shikimate kinase [Methylomusa anaerophila]BBB93309.1 Shikimate kinase 1 [Methylomusa anaerophila]HML86860.1 shikimate kinase [Methylomusa anaerophila]
MRNVVLIGFMGTGKTSTGRLLAGRLKRPFIDIDKKIEQESSMSISEIFQIYGETHFRQLEKEAIFRVSRHTNTVIATGGGAVLFPENMVRLKTNGVIIALNASVEAILERTFRPGVRPLLDADDRRDTVVKLLNERDPYYRRADFMVDTSDCSPHDVAEKIIDFLRQGGYLRGRSNS